MRWIEKNERKRVTRINWKLCFFEAGLFGKADFLDDPLV